MSEPMVDEDEPSRVAPHWKGRLASGLPVALLLAVIAWHGFQIMVHEDDPQRNGAFAMFSTVDIGATRKVLVTARDGAVVVDVPASLHERHAALLDLPTEDSAEELASLLRGLTWQVEEGVASPGGDDTLGDVRLQVVGLETDGHTILRHVLVDVAVGSGS